MSEIRCALELREDGATRAPRLYARLLAYGQEITHQRGKERFESRSLSWDESGIVLYRTHDGEANAATRKPVMITVPRQTDEAALIDAEIPDTPTGRKLVQEIRNGTWKGLSVEFRAVGEAVVDGVRSIQKALLTGAAFVRDPAYSTATVEVRRRHAVYMPHIPRS